MGLSVSLVGGSLERDGLDWPALWFARDAAARLVVGRDLTVFAANANALSLIEANGVFSVRDGALGARDRRCLAELTAIVGGANCEPKFGVAGTGSGSALLVDAFALDEDAASPVAVTLRDLGATAEIECADLEAMFGVTPGEHQVIVQLLKGFSSREIAAEFGKSILTVRTHVKRAYGKIGVKTRGQLFARLLPYLSIR